MLDLIEPKNKRIERMEDNMKMKDEKIRLLNEEVREYRAAYMLLQEKEVNTREDAPEANH